MIVREGQVIINYRENQTKEDAPRFGPGAVDIHSSMTAQTKKPPTFLQPTRQEAPQRTATHRTAPHHTTARPSQPASQPALDTTHALASPSADTS